MSAPAIKLNTGTSIPQIGLGLWKMKDEQECKQAVKWALEAGYRHFDTAQVYGNEAFLGAALQESRVARKEVFITTKIRVDNFTSWRLQRSFAESLKKLQTDYVDLLLLHFPVPLLRGRAWHELEKLHEAGQATSIGVSNYTTHHLESLLQECSIKPVVNQIEQHVFLQQPELTTYCLEHDIAVEAYSPLAHAHGLDDPALTEIAQKYGKTTAQIMLRWCVEQECIVLPKSVHQVRIQQNIDIFDFALAPDDVARLKELDKNLHTAWDPTHVP